MTQDSEEFTNELVDPDHGVWFNNNFGPLIIDYLFYTGVPGVFLFFIYLFYHVGFFVWVIFAFVFVFIMVRYTYGRLVIHPRRIYLSNKIIKFEFFLIRTKDIRWDIIKGIKRYEMENKYLLDAFVDGKIRPNGEKAFRQYIIRSEIGSLMIMMRGGKLDEHELQSQYESFQTGDFSLSPAQRQEKIRDELTMLKPVFYFLFGILPGVIGLAYLGQGVLPSSVIVMLFIFWGVSFIFVYLMTRKLKNKLYSLAAE